MIEAGIVILNCNGSPFVVQALRRTIESVGASDLRAEIVFVDNASDDDSVPLLRSHFPGLHLVELHERVGFSSANNIGAEAAAPAEFLLFINADAWLTPHALNHLVRFLREHREYGAVAPVEKAPDGRIRRTWWPYPTPVRVFGMLPGHLGWNRLFPRRYTLDPAGKEWQALARRKVIDVPYLPGYCLLIRASVFKEAGGWDEQYPFYSEDVDLGYRLRHVGWKQGVATAAFAFHIGGASSVNVNHDARLEKLWAARVLFCHKHFRDGARLLRAFALLADRVAPARATELKIALRQLKSLPRLEASPCAGRRAASCCYHGLDPDARVSVIIPTFNRIEGLRSVLPSYLGAECVGQVLVVLDGLTTVPPELESMDWAAPVSPEFIAPGCRIGQPQSRMLGVQAARHDWVLFGEDDVALHPDYVARLTGHLAGGAASVAAGRIVNARHGQSLLDARAAADRSLGSPLNMPTLQSDFSRLCPGVHRVPFLHSVALMPKQLILELGFDNGYRGNQYREETDFYVRAFARGSILIWDNEALCYHYRGGPFRSGGQRSGRARSLLWTILNNHRFSMRNEAVLRTTFGIPNPWLFSSRFAVGCLSSFLVASIRTALRPLLRLAIY